MQILPFRETDLNSLPSVQPPDWPDLRIAFRYYLNHLIFCSPIKVVEEDIFVGVGTTILHNDVAWLAHIVVHPEFRNRGIGRIITETLIDSLKKYSLKTISLVATDLGKPVYEKIGFEIVGEYVFFKCDDHKNEIQFSNKIVKSSPKYFDVISEIDKKASGEDRSNQLVDYFSNSYIYCEENKVEGYYLPDFGDGLIISKNPVAGIELMKFRNTTHNMAAIPKENNHAINFLNENNFKEYRTAKRMSMGEKVTWKPEMMYNRISGQVG